MDIIYLLFCQQRMSASSGYLKLTVTATIIVGFSIATYMYFTKKDENEKPLEANHTESLKLPVIDFNLFFEKDKHPDLYKAECEKVAYALHHYGVVILKDPRVKENDNNIFLDMMEKYFEGSDGLRDARPEYAYQVGVTKDLIELPRNHCKILGTMGPNNKPLSPCPPELDPKWRFFWRTGPRPIKTEFPSENMDAVIPTEFPQWKEVMDMWGGEMTDALFTLAEMAAIGFNLPYDAFTSLMIYGPHLLAPTGSDFNKYGNIGTVLAGFHYDLNFLTIHGKSRFPGLYIWTRDGKRTAVVVPDGCLIVQVSSVVDQLLYIVIIVIIYTARYILLLLLCDRNNTNINNYLLLMIN